MRLQLTFLMVLMLMAMPAFGQFYDGTYGSPNQNRHPGWENPQTREHQRQLQQNMQSLATPGGWGTPSQEQQFWRQQMLQEQRSANMYRWQRLQQNQKPAACGILPTDRYARAGC